MASFQMHLSVAKIYMEHYQIQNEQEFISGVLDPDLAVDKTMSHYSDERKTFTLEEIIKTKVNLKKYLKENKMDSDYKKGEFLHLLTDYDFFNNFIDQKYKNMPYEAFFENLYYSYDLLNPYLTKKYSVNVYSYQKILEKKIEGKKETLKSKKLKNILEEQKVDQWIQKIGNTNLEIMAEKILNS